MMTRLARIRADLPTATYEPGDVAWLLETVDKLAAGLRVAKHSKKVRQRVHERSCIECSALARLEEPESK